MFGLFKSKSKKSTDLGSYADLVGADMHSHLIPGIDDGAKTMDDTLELIRRQIDLGMKKIITTPHIMSDYYRNTPEIILDGLAKVRVALQEAGIDIPMEAAAEYYFDEYFEQKVDEKSVLTMGDNYLLFELSFVNPPPNLVAVVQKIKDQGYKPILAHPERYTYMKMDEYENLKNWGCYFQLNTISLTGYYSSATKHIAQSLIEQHWIDFVGSDMHHTRHADALGRALRSSHLEKLLVEQGVQNKIFL
ncbi:MAG: capsular biosynthesis protein [Mucilaginibacter polytrichastri]|nr:capsular biosynthesis protein [Mucilaginibacter polytrichastri]